MYDIYCGNILFFYLDSNEIKDWSENSRSLTDKTRCIFLLFTVAPSTSNEIVHLDVGGHLYTTLKFTLKKYESYALENILKNCDRDGNVVLDRDGRMFYYILRFLRTGELSLPDDFSEFDSLTYEVNCFDIGELKRCLEVEKQKKEAVI